MRRLRRGRGRAVLLGLCLSGASSWQRNDKINERNERAAERRLVGLSVVGVSHAFALPLIFSIFAGLYCTRKYSSRGQPCAE